jgi:hypothetical protein
VSDLRSSSENSLPTPQASSPTTKLSPSTHSVLRDGVAVFPKGLPPPIFPAARQSLLSRATHCERRVRAREPVSIFSDCQSIGIAAHGLSSLCTMQKRAGRYPVLALASHESLITSHFSA